MASPASQPLTHDAIQALLRTKTFGRTLHLFQEVSSTNHEAMKLTQQGAPDGSLRVMCDPSSGGGMVEVRAGDVVHLR